MNIFRWVFQSIIELINTLRAKTGMHYNETIRAVDIEQVDTSSIRLNPSTEPPVVAGPYTSLCDIVKQGYSRIVMHRVFTPEFDRESSAYILNPTVDGWNVIESTCLLAAHRLGVVTSNTIASSVDHRIVLCASFCIVCKNAVDHEAFPTLIQSIYEKTPLAIIYHIFFQKIVRPWSRPELDVWWVQKRIEAAEGYILVHESPYRYFNDSPTIRFEMETYKRLLESNKNIDIMSLSILRNIASFYVYTALSSADADLNSLAMATPTPAFVSALACVAVKTVDVCEITGGPVLNVPDSIIGWGNTSPLAMRLVDAALQASARDPTPPAAAYPFDFETITHVRTLLI